MKNVKKNENRLYTHINTTEKTLMSYFWASYGLFGNISRPLGEEFFIFL